MLYIYIYILCILLYIYTHNVPILCLHLYVHSVDMYMTWYGKTVCIWTEMCIGHTGTYRDTLLVLWDCQTMDLLWGFKHDQTNGCDPVYNQLQTWTPRNYPSVVCEIVSKHCYRLPQMGSKTGQVSGIVTLATKKFGITENNSGIYRWTEPPMMRDEPQQLKHEDIQLQIIM